MIDMTKQYTYKNGAAARILCTDRPLTGNLVVLSMRSNGAIVQSTIDGKSQCCNGEYDLVEVWQPKEGEIVWCWDDEATLPSLRKYDKCRAIWNHYAPFIGTLPEAFMTCEEK